MRPSHILYGVALLFILGAIIALPGAASSRGYDSCLLGSRLDVSPWVGSAIPSGGEMTRPRRNPIREDRIENEAIVDAPPEEQAMSWY